jgi:hypothetical protein
VSSVLAFAPSLGRPEGSLTAQLTLDGTLAAPRPGGYLELHEVAFSLAALAQPFSHVNGRVELDGRTLRIRRLSAQDRDGKLGARGEFRLAQDGSGSGKLALSADKFPLRQQGTIIGELSVQATLGAQLASNAELDLALVLEEGRLWLTGERGRKVQSLERHPDVRFSDQPAAQLVEVAPTDTGVTLRSLTFRSARDLWLMHQDFSVQVGVDVELARVAGEPRLTGQATLRRGDLKLLGKSFELERGTVTFTGDTPPDPALDLKASFQPPSGQKLIVQVSGRASAPELTFSGAADNAGAAVAVLSGVRSPGAESKAQNDAKNFAMGVTAGLLTMTARREFGDWVPMLSVETNESGAVSQARAGFDASDLIPPFLERVARGAYVEGVVGQRSDSQSGSVGLGVRLEVALPRDFITTMGYGPGPAWSVDAAWVP